MSSTGTRRRSHAPACPVCSYADQVVPIAYGMPSPAMVEQSQHGELALGGTFPCSDRPQWYCKGCLQSFVASAAADGVERAG